MKTVSKDASLYQKLRYSADPGPGNTVGLELEVSHQLLTIEHRTKRLPKGAYSWSF